MPGEQAALSGCSLTGRATAEALASRLYDWFSWFYRLFSKVAFPYIGMPKEPARREVLDRLEPDGGRVLEVSIGPGVNVPYLVGRPDVGDVHGLDISLASCVRVFDVRQGWMNCLEFRKRGIQSENTNMG